MMDGQGSLRAGWSSQGEQEGYPLGQYGIIEGHSKRYVSYLGGSDCKSEGNGGRSNG